MVPRTYKKLSRKQNRYLKTKRILDVLFSLILILLLFPALILIYFITICTSKGPGIFVHKRYGKNLKIFGCLKFRSFKAGTPIIAPFTMSEEDQKKYITKWGRFIRKTSIDELPQLFNILIGDMSLVGPRPGSASNEEYLKDERLKQPYNSFDIRPGLTGYAQVYMNRSHKPIDKAYFDSEYMSKMCFLLDCKICIKTILKMFYKGK